MTELQDQPVTRDFGALWAEFDLNFTNNAKARCARDKDSEYFDITIPIMYLLFKQSVCAIVIMYLAVTGKHP